MSNLLGRETSPYLLQHKDNPVHWRVWGEDALREAKESGKPLLVSVGYAACHWCHVMAHESFEDIETARLMNALYVCVKIDREERPDVDHWLQSALSALGQNGGWPLTAFLTSEGHVFYAGTYFPNTARYGLPDFKTVLQQIADHYRADPAGIAGNADKIAAALTRASAQNRAGRFDPAMLDEAALRTAQRFDIFFGGMTGAPKFLNVPNLELLWRAFLRSSAPQYRQIMIASLDAMCQGGLYDHLGGGFARYSTDERWRVPHFEKMLYDNTQLIEILTLVWQREQSVLYHKRVEGTVAWLLREMRTEGAFASSLDADSPGPDGNTHEGAFYVWQAQEIDAALGARAAQFRKAYDITPTGQLDGANVLSRLWSPPVSPEMETELARDRAVLFAMREHRVHPGRDDKVLSDWNGLAIAALAGAAFAFNRADWLTVAQEAFASVCAHLGEGDRLYHSYRAGRRQHPAFADGYAHMARAALNLWEATGEDSYLERARAWVTRLNEDYWDEESGGYRFTLPREAPVRMIGRSAFDTATPGANGAMTGVLARLYFATGETPYMTRANALIEAFAGDVGGHFLQMATYLNGAETLIDGLQIVIVGARNDARTRALIDAVREESLPGRLMMVVDDGGMLPADHPAYRKHIKDGYPAAYICRRRSCTPPLTDPAALHAALRG
jgi:uncharacterized protein YyaL (SSP411 family)